MKKLLLFLTLVLITGLNSTASSSVEISEEKVKLNESHLTCVTCTYVTGSIRTTRGTCAAARAAHIRKF